MYQLFIFLSFQKLLPCHINLLTWSNPNQKKTVTRKASLASLPDIKTANDVADNPPVPPPWRPSAMGMTLSVSEPGLHEVKMKLFARATSLMMMGIAIPVIENHY
jgi:hypothetical protein